MKRVEIALRWSCRSRCLSSSSCILGDVLNVKMSPVLVPFSQGPPSPTTTPGLSAPLTHPGGRPRPSGPGMEVGGGQALSSRGNTRRVPRLETFWPPIPRSRSSASSELLLVRRPPSRLVEAVWEPEEPFAVTVLSP